eukprot:TRINITY_DN58418_c0_g1_i1.p1 TRINITY_DN58418_c0_g1~~TRINITY_DN58418_c0_g1_i1.p1  ORF type:complete len:655 (-),score=165.76 TRINITY_DN58418_c0_g1_i1:63-2000(-)
MVLRVVCFVLVTLTGRAEQVNGPVIGIDLGTTYSCAGIFKNGMVEIIPNDQGNRIMPSYVAFTDQELLVGEAAKNQAASNPTQTVYDAKRFIGRSYKDSAVQQDIKLLPYKIVADKNGMPAAILKVKGEEKMVKPEEIASAILAKLKKSAEEYLGTGVHHAVISVPAHFNDAQRKATKDAGAIAGLEVLKVINEPTAAALAYGFEKKAEETVLVYDLGGGTCDATVLKVGADGSFQVLATSGDPHLGGEDFDQRVMDHLMKVFSKKNKKDMASDQQALQKLRTEVEKLKRKLSTVPQAPIKIASLFEGIALSETITRAQFEKLNSELFKRTLEPVKQVLADAKLSKGDISNVVLTGGSARIPKVQQLLSEFFEGKELVRTINPDEAVAHGAAIQGASLSSQGLDPGITLIDVTPLSLGIQTAGGFMTTVIPRNSALPTENTMVFSTYKDNQERATVKVFQGERAMANFNYHVGSFEIRGIGPAPRGHPQIAVTFKIDASGLLSVQATDRGTGKSEEFTVTEEKNQLSKDTIEEMIKDAEVYAKSDEQERSRVEARMELKALLVRLRAAAEASGEEDATKLQAAAAEGQDWLDSNPTAEADEVKVKREELEAKTPDLPHPSHGGSGSQGEGESPSGDIDMEGHEEL